MKVKALISENTIVIHPSDGGEQINIQKDTDRLLYAEVAELIENQDEEALIEKYLDIKGKIERFSHRLFTVDNSKGVMMLKGDDTPMPEAIIKRLLVLEKSGEDFMPLIRFWKKLKENDQDVIDQLYGFLAHNDIPLTETGDIITEKGVEIKNGMLVDGYTQSVDNNIGSIVEIQRSLVVKDPNRTCAKGLHVGAPKFVRNHWRKDVIIQCIVDPRDVVSIPKDYNNTKMRVCKYTVAGYSTENQTDRPVYKLSDFVTAPNEYLKGKISDTKQLEFEAVGFNRNSDNVKVSKVEQSDEQIGAKYVQKATEELEDLTAPQALDYVEEITEIRMPYNPKSKRTIIRRGIEILSKYYENED